MLTAYFDESYNQRTAKNPNTPLFYTVACWLSTVEQWKKFGKKWTAILHGVGIQNFHMKDYESRQKEYKDWPNAKRIKVLQQLHSAIKQHKVYGCSITVNCNAYDVQVKPLLMYRKHLGMSYYGFCVQRCIMEMNEWCDKKQYPGPIQYMFAELQKQAGALDRIFVEQLRDQELKGKYRLSGTWTKALAACVPQLQAADIIAYEANKWAVEYMNKGEPVMRKSLENLRLINDFDHYYFGSYEISNLTRKIS